MHFQIKRKFTSIIHHAKAFQMRYVQYSDQKMFIKLLKNNISYFHVFFSFAYLLWRNFIGKFDLDSVLFNKTNLYVKLCFEALIIIIIFHMRRNLILPFPVFSWGPLEIWIEVSWKLKTKVWHWETLFYKDLISNINYLGCLTWKIVGNNQDFSSFLQPKVSA